VTGSAHQARGQARPPVLTEIERRFINRYQGGFPLLDRPFAAVARELATDEGTLIASIRGLLDAGFLSRFGPLFDAERLGGRFTLAAMAVPDADFDAVASRLAALPAVAHNYRRDHSLNMWFVLATPSEPAMQETLGQIQALTGLKVLDFPKLAEYHLGFWLQLGADGSLAMRRWARPASAEGQGRAVAEAARAVAGEMNPAAGEARPTGEGARAVAGEERTLLSATLDERDLALVAATQAGLPLVPEPYAAIAKQLDLSPAQVRERLAGLLARGAIRRIGAVPNHYRLGLRGNGMTVWDIDDASVDQVGAEIAALEGVSHCYRRPRRPPLWPYNLFAMLHGRDRAEVLAAADRVVTLVSAHCRGHAILFSQAVLKKTGLRFTAPEPTPPG